jgi:hypothetical protein
VGLSRAQAPIGTMSESALDQGTSHLLNRQRDEVVTHFIVSDSQNGHVGSALKDSAAGLHPQEAAAVCLVQRIGVRQPERTCSHTGEVAQRERDNGERLTCPFDGPRAVLQLTQQLGRLRMPLSHMAALAVHFGEADTARGLSCVTRSQPVVIDEDLDDEAMFTRLSHTRQCQTLVTSGARRARRTSSSGRSRSLFLSAAVPAGGSVGSRDGSPPSRFRARRVQVNVLRQ